VSASSVLFLRCNSVLIAIADRAAGGHDGITTPLLRRESITIDRHASRTVRVVPWASGAAG